MAIELPALSDNDLKIVARMESIQSLYSTITENVLLTQGSAYAYPDGDAPAEPAAPAEEAEPVAEAEEAPAEEYDGLKMSDVLRDLHKVNQTARVLRDRTAKLEKEVRDMRAYIAKLEAALEKERELSGDRHMDSVSF